VATPSRPSGSSGAGVTLGTPAGVAVHLSQGDRSPLRAIGIRLILGLAVLLVVVVSVYLDRDGYIDEVDGTVSWLDAFYYATVSLSTTGYGDIAPVTDRARLFNVLIVTPARIAFIIVLVGTTVEVLTERSREALAVRRWRRTLHQHIVVCGFGTKGRSAVAALMDKGTPSEKFVVVDTDQIAVEEANAKGLNVILGSASRADVLRQAGVQRATTVIVAPKTDDAAVLITLTARELNPRATIVAAVREAENSHLLKQSGADSVITTSEAAGRLLGLSTDSPRLVNIVEDLLTSGSGMEIVERDAPETDVGRSARNLREPVVAIVRDGEMHRFDSPEANRIEAGDRLIYVNAVTNE
jgi:voltage-gated potassium channel